MKTREGSKRLKTHNEMQSNALSEIRKKRQAKSLTQESSDEEGPEEPPQKKSNEDYEKKSTPKEDKRDYDYFTLELFNKLFIRRFWICKFLNSQNFKDTITGCFVRVKHGYDQSGYRIYEVVGIVEKNEYRLEQLTTKYHIRGRFLENGHEKEFEMDLCSNSGPSPEEFDTFKKSAIKSKQIPDAKTIAEKEKLITNVDALPQVDISKEEEEQKNEKFQTKYNIGQYRAELKGKINVALTKGDAALLKTLTEELELLDEKEKLLMKKRQNNEYKINLKNKDINQEVEVDQDSTKKSNVLSELDPFSRRRTVISNPFEVSILNQYKEIKKDEMLETKEVVVKEVNPEETLKKVHDFDIEINMNLEETTKKHQKIK